MTPEDTCNRGEAPSPNSDRAFAQCLRQLEEAWRSDETISQPERIALAALIATFDLETPDSGIVRAVARLLADGADIEVLRDDFARAAGIFDLPMLRRFAGLDELIAGSQVETIDITGLSDAELLSLFG